MLYELKSIFRNKITWVFLIVCTVITMQTLITLEADILDTNGSKKEIKHNADYMETECQEDIDSTKKDWDYSYNTICDTEEKKKIFLNDYNYTIWQRDAYKELSDYMDKEKIDWKEVSRKIQRINLIEEICAMERASDEKNGYARAETVFAKELKENADFLRLDQLGFEISGLADSPFYTNTEREENIPIYLGHKAETSGWFDQLKYPDTVNMYTPSPFTILGRLFCMNTYLSMIFASMILLFSAFYMIQCRKEGSRQLQELRPEGRNRVAFEYYGKILMAVALILMLSVGIVTIGMGCVYGWKGIHTAMYCDPVNFTGMVPYKHFQDYDITNLGKIYHDYEYHGYPTEITMYPLKTMELGKFLILAGVLALLKVVFLSLLGFVIGYIGKNNTRQMVLSGIAVSIYVASQFIEKGMKWNPFAVKTAWDVTVGGTNMTWLNAMLILIGAIIVLILLLIKMNHKRDYC